MLVWGGTLRLNRYSCCVMPVNDQNKLLAMNEEGSPKHMKTRCLSNYKLRKAGLSAFKTPVGNNGRAYVVKSNKPTDKVLFLFHEWWGLNDYIKQEAGKNGATNWGM